MPERGWQAIHGIADRAVGAVAAAITQRREAWRARWRSRGGAPRVPELSAALADVDADDIEANLRQLMASSARRALRDDAAPAPTALVDAMTMTNPFAVAEAARAAGELVRGIDDESMSAIRRIVTTSVRAGGSPADQARLIELVIGLDERAAVAVTNFEAGLRSRAAAGLNGSALGRERALAPRVPARLTMDRVDALTERYAQRLLRHRATTIARTETIRAANQGVRLAGDQLARAGLVARGALAWEWIVTPDDRLCPRCAPMDGQIVRVDGDFRELGGDRVAVTTPPLHPSCRCAIARKVPEV